jgi:hypothetical protein
MKTFTAFVFSAFLVLFAVFATAQVGRFPPDDRSPRMKRSQMEALLKQEHERALDDAARLLELAEELKVELEEKDKSVLSIAAIKKTEEIEKLAKRIRNRMKRY